MNLRENKRIKWNIFFILVYIVFLFSFSTLRGYFNRQNIQISIPNRALIIANSSTGLVSNVFKNITNYFLDKKVLFLKINTLEKELEIEKEKNIALSVNSKFSSSENDFKVLSAKKIFSDFTTIYSSVLLNKGYLDGVEEKSLVFIYPNKAIGIIERVGNKTSLLSLFSKDKNQIEGILKIKVEKDIFEEQIIIESDTAISNATTSTSTILDIKPSSILIKSGEQIIVDIYGYGGGDFIARLPKNIEVSIGTKIYLANDEDKVLGEIIKVEKPEASFYQIILIEGYYNTRENNIYYIQKL